jgi:anthranilate/para-aminobenzoate synthase component I
MNRFLLLLTFASLSVISFAQKGDFDFGKVTYKELEMSKYEPDTSAVAVVLNEFGQARINDEQNVIFDYHVKIKILKSLGQREGNIYIPLYKNGSYVETLLSAKGSTFNFDANHAWKENKLDPKNVFTEKTNKYLNEVKFALPDVRVGSVIEVMYSTESPFRFQFHPWEFQSDIPKINSEYWCKIPANWIYNITLRGYFKLSKMKPPW